MVPSFFTVLSESDRFSKTLVTEEITNKNLSQILPLAKFYPLALAGEDVLVDLISET